MSEFERFHYESLAEVQETLARLDVEMLVSDDVSVLADPLPIGPRLALNRLAVQPMEGCDCTPDGSPVELTRRRYRRFAAGGAGLIWFEACAVVPQGRGNPRQMMLTGANVGEFARLLGECCRVARMRMGPRREPIFILQLHHAGRYSAPEGRRAPILAHHSPELDRALGIPPDHQLISDEELDRLQDAFVRAAGLAARAGFDGVDVKAAHGYLLNGLLAAFTREDSRYGGPAFEDRTRMLLETHHRIASEYPELLVTARVNLYDAMPHPHGWGVDAQDRRRPDPTEPVRLARALRRQGAPCLNVTAGNPYYHPHCSRPHDGTGKERPPEHPLAGVGRLVGLARAVQEACPDLPVIGAGYTYLRQFVPQFGAGAVASGWAAMMGLGRMALAYPDFARDIVLTGELDPRKTCVACGLCTEIMRGGGAVGCPVRDQEIYAPILRSVRAGAGGSEMVQPEGAHGTI